MNRIFRIVWNHALSQPVVTSELAHGARGGSGSSRSPLRALALSALSAAMFAALPALAADLPSGAILDMNNGSAGNSASNVAGQFQTYTVDFTATSAGNNYVLFAFRQDPAYWTFGNVYLYAAGDTTTNLFTNPLFLQGGEVQGAGVQAPANWGVVYQTGTVPRAAGTWYSGPNADLGGGGSWYDGAVGSFDGIYQGVSLLAGTTYTIGFTAMSDDATNSNDIRMGVFAGECVSLTGPVAECTPNNPDFTVLATPDEAADAGGPTTVVIDTTKTSTDVGTADGAFEGGTLLVDQPTVTLEGDFTVDGQGGTIDQAGHEATFTGTISDADGASGDLHVANSGSGGGVTLTGTNTYTGQTTIDAGAKLALGQGGSIATSSGVVTNGTFDVSDAGGDTTVGSLGGAGAVQLGTNDLIIADGRDTFSGTIAGTGGVALNGGHERFTGSNTYTGGTSVTGGSTLSISRGDALGTGTLNLNASTLEITNNATLSNTIGLTGASTIDTDANFVSTGAVSGSGKLIKDGAGTADFQGVLSHTGGTEVREGTLVLEGNNTYTGGTVINGGELQVGSDQNLGHAGDSLVLNGGVLHTTGQVDTGRTLTLNGGSIAVDANTILASTAGTNGTGGLVKNGEGTLSIAGNATHAGGTTVNDGVLVLGGNNTYTGGTVINGGELQVSSDANLGDRSNGLVLNGGTLHTTTDLQTARNITVGQGALAVDAGTTLRSTGAVTGNGTLIKNGAGVAAFTGNLSHVGGTVVNEGNLILSGANTYTGGNVLNGGTLTVSKDNNLGAAANTLTFNGGTLATTTSFSTQRTMVLNAGGGAIDTAQGTTLSQQGSIVGTGGLVKRGGGTLVVSGANSFTGGTLIDGGTVRIDSGSSLGTGAIVLRGGMLESYASLGTGQQVLVSGDSGIDVLAGTSTVLSGDIVAASDSGCFVKTGAGSLSLTGHASLGKGTCVQDGTLRANGMLDSSFVSVDRIGTLRGIGAISGPVTVQGRLAPGNSPGTLAVNGTVTMLDGSTFEADIDGLGTGTGRGSYSRLLIVGAGHQFVADGSLEPLLRDITGDASNTYVPALGDNYRIVSAEGGIVGRFDTVVQPLGLAANTRFVAFYDLGGSQSIDLRVVPTAYSAFLPSDASRNTQALAGALDGAINAQVAGTADAYAASLGAIAAINTDALPGTLKALAGEVHADQAASARGMGLAVSRDAIDHLGTDTANPANHAWANLTQDGQRADADKQGSGFDTSNNHFTAGVDVWATDSTVIGVGASHGDSDVNASGGHGTIRSNAGLVYAQQKVGSVLVDGVVAHGSDDWSTRRSDPFGMGMLESHADGSSTTASVTARLPMAMESARIEPYVGVVWQQVKRDAVQETGASPAALSLERLSVTGTRGLVGVNAGSKASDPLAAEQTWRLGAAVGVDSRGLLDPTVRAELAGQTFETQAPDAGRGFVQVNASGTVRLSQRTYLYGSLNAEQGSGRSAYGLTAGLRVAF